MPELSSRTSDGFFRYLFIGNSGAGKTGALASLVPHYDLRIIDLDNGLDALAEIVSDKYPDRLSSIQFETFRDRMKMSQSGPRVVGSPKAYVNTLSALDSWPTDNSDPAEWGKDKLLVIDSLTNVGRAAMLWAKAANPTTKDPRQWYKTAQDLVEDLIANLTSEDFKTNVIVISHIELTETASGLQKGYASSIGKALGPKLPRFFNTLLLSETKGVGKNLKRQIHTIPTAMIDVKVPNPKKLSEEYDISDGLIKIVRGQK